MIDYLIQNYVLLIVIAGMYILTVFDVFLDKRMLRKLRITLVGDMRTEIEKTEYTCAFGFSVAGTPEEMIKEADSMMYRNKAEMKAEMSEKGQEFHLRS